MKREKDEILQAVFEEIAKLIKNVNVERAFELALTANSQRIKLKNKIKFMLGI